MQIKLKIISQNSCTLGYQGSEKDNEVKGKGNSYTTHFRQLDTRLGRWLSIDPKANAIESPYVSMGNSPLWINDPMGDTIQITGNNGDVVNYDNGQAYNLDGSAYSGNDDFINTTVNALNSIESNSRYGSGMIWALQESEFVTSIMKVGSITEGKNQDLDDINRFISDSPNVDDSPKKFRLPKNRNGKRPSKKKGTGIGSGGIVIWDPSDGVGGLQTNGTNTRPIVIGLAHELAHAFDAIFGDIRRDIAPKTSMFRAEIFATHVENIIRADMSLPLRLNYNPNRDTGARRLLDECGDSRFYFQPDGSSYDYYGNSGQIVPFTNKPDER